MKTFKKKVVKQVKEKKPTKKIRIKVSNASMEKVYRKAVKELSDGVEPGNLDFETIKKLAERFVKSEKQLLLNNIANAMVEYKTCLDKKEQLIDNKQEVMVMDVLIDDAKNDIHTAKDKLKKFKDKYQLIIENMSK